jgi:hypothetical protein
MLPHARAPSRACLIYLLSHCPACLPAAYRADLALGAKTIRDFDDAITRVAFGWPDGEPPGATCLRLPLPAMRRLCALCSLLQSPAALCQSNSDSAVLRMLCIASSLLLQWTLTTKGAAAARAYPTSACRCWSSRQASGRHACPALPTACTPQAAATVHLCSICIPFRLLASL